jgi:L-rhamnose mutarotase
MQRVCFVLQVKPDRLGEYKERHRNVWPEMQAALRETGWGIIRCSCEVTGFWSAIWRQKTLKALALEWPTRAVNERWQREMADFFVQPDGVLPDRAMQPLEEVFHL